MIDARADIVSRSVCAKVLVVAGEAPSAELLGYDIEVAAAR